MRTRLIIIGTIAITLLLGASYWQRKITWIVSASDAEQFGIELAKEKQSVERCLTVTTIFPSYPPTEELQGLCIYGYAGESKDPSACELLMPSEYGFTCIGEALGEQACRFGINGRSVDWGSNTAGTHVRSSLGDCLRDLPRSEEGQNCCEIAKVVNLLGVDDCTRVADNSSMRDLCQGELALKFKDVSICTKIGNANYRVACELWVRYRHVLTNYPDPIPLSVVQ